jgi:phosphoglucosamine mutase
MKYQLPFGTHGIRGNANLPPFTQRHLRALGQALELFLEIKSLPKHILFGSDSRESATRIKRFLSEGFSSATTIQNANELPTPALKHILKKNIEIGLGIMITASHNPAHDNGLKFFLQGGDEFTPEDETRIQNLFSEIFSNKYPHQGSLINETLYPSAFLTYFTQIKKKFAPQFLAGLHIGLDCANGATSQYAPAIFQHFGAQVTTINAKPNGLNINNNCGSNHPDQLKALVLVNKLFCGFAFDGDGDRVVAISSHGALNDGDDILAIIASNPTRKKRGPVVGTIASNSALKKHLQKNNLEFLASNIGEHQVIKTMNTHGSNLGGEPSGHIIIREYLMASDGIFTALALLDAILLTNNFSLSSFEHYPQYSTNIPTPIKPPLSTPELKKIIDEYNTKHPECSILVRYSGTEPVMRISAEAPTMAQATALTQEMSAKISNTIAQLTEQNTLATTAQPVPEKIN